VLKKEEAMRTLMLVRHRVADYDAWKQAYDDFRDNQRRGGVRFHQVLRSPEDPNLVVVTHVFDDEEAAKAFADSPELREAMARAGVEEASVSIEYLDEADAEEL
jgi:heme-degrading monooxygenase HmoA